MSEQLHLEVLTPHQKVLEAKVDWVAIPGEMGELGILPEHVPLMTTIKSGLLSFAADGETKHLAVHYGYAQVEGLKVRILSEMAERLEDIDLDRARDAESRARETLQGMISEQEAEEYRVQKYEAKLQRAFVRQSLSG